MEKVAFPVFDDLFHTVTGPNSHYNSPKSLERDEAQRAFINAMTNVTNPKSLDWNGRIDEWMGEVYNPHRGMRKGERSAPEIPCGERSSSHKVMISAPSPSGGFKKEYRGESQNIHYQYSVDDVFGKPKPKTPKLCVRHDTRGHDAGDEMDLEESEEYDSDDYDDRREDPSGQNIHRQMQYQEPLRQKPGLDDTLTYGFRDLKINTAQNGPFRHLMKVDRNANQDASEYKQTRRQKPVNSHASSVYGSPECRM